MDRVNVEDDLMLSKDDRIDDDDDDDDDVGTRENADALFDKVAADAANNKAARETETFIVLVKQSKKCGRLLCKA